MKYGIMIVAFVALTVFCLGTNVYGEEVPSLTEFGEKVKELVLQYYPKAEVSVTGKEIAFEYGARDFMIHDMNKMGMWEEEAYETKGPERKLFAGKNKKESGIVGYIEIMPGKHLYATTRPQTLDRLYFKTLMLAPESEKKDCFLMVDLDYPDTVNEEFLKKFTKLANEFEKYLK